MKVLIVDDEIDLSLLLKSHFTRKGHNVLLAHALDDGLEQVDIFKPDVLLLDNNLPDGTGWKWAPEIATRFPSIYIFLISAYHPAIPDMPANAHFKVLEKPISLQDFDAQLNKMSY